jgi:hypothetical protein
MKIYDWIEVHTYYDEGHSFYRCMQRFGFCRAAWHKAVKRGDIRPRPLGRPIAELLANGSSGPISKNASWAQAYLRIAASNAG